ncbi:hypothetical protein [Caulobacter hibisci]|uniref:Uncharacterized protein n=1 Tax=Caulobacter hibisci TaxID=2035993 RepID=A0ABS0T4R0_9CAUL|nr:hypothetical protein [Caulobacter hibisci]MBI1686869.1 hypothetical protein [Caulobacter hibisci]
MTDPRSDLAARLMALAARNPPADRIEWAAAMRGEFATLDHGRLSWATGCLAASLVWRAPGEASYAALLAGGVYVIGWGMSRLGWALFERGLLSVEAGLVLPLPTLLIGTFVLALLAGLARPGRAAATALVLGLAPSLIGLALGAGPLGTLEAAGAPAAVALALLTGLAAFGAVAGAWLGARPPQHA